MQYCSILPDVGPVYTVSIIPTGRGAAGYTMPLPERDEMFNSKGKMLQYICVALAEGLQKNLYLTILQQVLLKTSNKQLKLLGTW